MKYAVSLFYTWYNRKVANMLQQKSYKLCNISFKGFVVWTNVERRGICLLNILYLSTSVLDKQYKRHKHKHDISFCFISHIKVKCQKLGLCVSLISLWNAYQIIWRDYNLISKTTSARGCYSAASFKTRVDNQTENYRMLIIIFMLTIFASQLYMSKSKKYNCCLF